jgi:hypothetical protein
MNVVVTFHQPVCLYSLAGEEGEPPRRANWLTGGPVTVVSFIFVFNNKLMEGVFSDLQHPEAFVFFAD